MGRAKKNFQDGVVQQLESAAAEPNNVLKQVLGDLPLAGDDLLMGILSSTSDRTVEPAPLATAHIQPADDAPTDAPLPEGLGEEVPGITADSIRKIEELQRRGKSVDEAEHIVRQQVPPMSPPAQNSGGGIAYPPPPAAPTGGFFSTPPEGDYQMGAEPEPLSPLDVKLNSISSAQIVKWYDIFQSLTSVWAYGHFSSPKQAVEVMEALTPKVTAGTATPEEVARYKAAQDVVLNYTMRKTAFAETVGMSEGLKQECTQLLGDILEARGVRIPPEMLLLLLFLSPLIVNGGRIMLEKMGFSDADKMVGQFSAFVGKQTKEYHDSRIR